MTKIIDNRAKTQWEKSNVSFENYQTYIFRKVIRYELTLIDLLYISNFKGGNATINESELIINSKLVAYSQSLTLIRQEFGTLSLKELNPTRILSLTTHVSQICSLTHKNSNLRIDGFGVSYLSALLNAYFPTLIPILDRRVLINLNLVHESDINSQGQIKNIEKFYPILIDNFATTTAQNGLSVREYDKELFMLKI